MSHMSHTLLDQVKCICRVQTTLPRDPSGSTRDIQEALQTLVTQGGPRNHGGHLESPQETLIRVKAFIFHGGLWEPARPQDKLVEVVGDQLLFEAWLKKIENV